MLAIDEMKTKNKHLQAENKSANALVQKTELAHSEAKTQVEHLELAAKKNLKIADKQAEHQAVLIEQIHTLTAQNKSLHTQSLEKEKEKKN